MTDHVAVVTGAGRGIGREVAQRLLSRGWTVIATDVDETAVRRTATELGAGCIPVHHDVRDANAHRDIATRAQDLGQLIAWVNNAGILRTGTLWEQDDATMTATVEINLLGVVNGTRAALEVMRAQGRRADIVNMSSMSAFGPLPGLAIYAASKAAVLSWTLTTAAELHVAKLPIRLHAVCPDGVRTDMVAENAADHGSAMIFSGALLDPAVVADEVVGLIGSKRIVRSIPRRRAAAARFSALAPRVTLPLIAATAALGEKNRRKAQRQQPQYH
jgi:NAD(P)-dependent dehydrogenase (short-subunit alcohol dehydrogenase family)